MKTESEILASSLADLQKLWVELKAVATNDRDYPTAKAVIELIEAHDDWEEPKTITAVATDNVIVDGKAVKKGESVSAFPWQIAALQRFFKSELKKIVGKAAALLLFGLVALSASAQVQTFTYGTFGQYNVQSIASLNGSTNSVVVGTNSFTAPIISTNNVVIPNWTFTNGIWTNAPTTNSLYSTNSPGVVSVVNYDSFYIQENFNLMGSGTTAVVTTYDTSVDGANWLTNAFSLSITPSGLTGVAGGTNITQAQYGFIRLNTISCAAAPGAGDVITNLIVQIAKKSNRQGP